MENYDDEKKYENVINSLQNLPKVKAENNFEADLMRRINSGNFKEMRSGFWYDILRPSKLIPTAAIAAVLIFMFIIKFDTAVPVDPLTIQPRLREDVVASNSSNSAVDEALNEQLKKNNISAGSAAYNTQNNNIGILTSSEIKSGLNFRLANITKTQRQQVIALKQKFELMVKNSRN